MLVCFGEDKSYCPDTSMDCKKCNYYAGQSPQAGSEAGSAEFALLNAEDIAVAEKLTKSILYRLEGNKNPPGWLVGSLNTLRGVLWKANKRSESI